jgi:hypothetical protein
MSIYRKLQAARYELVNSGLKKTGHNKHGGWYYYELSDFIPTVHKLFDAIGLCGVFTFGETATLTVYDTEDGASIQFSTPIVFAEGVKGQPIQLLGSTHTYLRRYLWLMAMEIVDSDAIDQEKQKEAPVVIATLKPTPAPAPILKLAPKPEPKPEIPKFDMKGKPGAWQITIAGEGPWDDLMTEAVGIALYQAQSPEDCVEIFKVNHSIFEKLKTEYPDRYTSLIATFKARKLSLTPQE